MPNLFADSDIAKSDSSFLSFALSSCLSERSSFFSSTLVGVGLFIDQGGWVNWTSVGGVTTPLTNVITLLSPVSPW